LYFLYIVILLKTDIIKMQARIHQLFKKKHSHKLLGVCITVCALSLGMPSDRAQDFFSSPNNFSMTGEIPLTQETINKVIEINEVLLNLKMTAPERQEFGDIMARYWHKEDGKLMKTVSQLLPIYDQFSQMPETARKESRRANLLTFLLDLDKNAKQNDEISKLMLRAYQRVHPAISPAAPYISAEVADAFINAYVFINEVKSGKQAPKFSEAVLTKMRQEVAADFAKMSEEKRSRFIQQMQRTTNLIINWPTMESWERLLTRAEVGAPLTPEEQQTAQQVRHMLQGHSMHMAISELNFIAKTQQDIMGSAPYWNPSSQAWEQKGGIVTEFR
jgi:predicted ATP-dependent protease